MLDDKHEILAIVAIVGLVAIVSVFGLFLFNAKAELDAAPVKVVKNVEMSDVVSGNDITGAATAPTDCCYYEYEGTATVANERIYSTYFNCKVYNDYDDPFKPGYVTYVLTNTNTSQNATAKTDDNCLTFTDKVAEYSCSGNVVLRKDYVCSHGCQKGVCVRQHKLVCPSSCTSAIAE